MTTRQDRAAKPERAAKQTSKRVAKQAPTAEQDRSAGRDPDVEQMRTRLERAQMSDQLVRLGRVMPGAELLDGYVRGVGGKWGVLARIEDGRVDGYVLFRLRDVARVWRKRHADRFVERSLALDGAWPPPGPELHLHLDSTHELLDGLAAAAELVAVHIEYVEPDVAFVGVPGRPGKRRFTMTEITTQGEWDEDLSRWDFTEVSRIDFGDDYLRRLLAVAGPEPTLA